MTELQSDSASHSAYSEITQRAAWTYFDRAARYNVIWNTPSKNAAGVMPLGNGDIAAGVYAIEDGDLYLLLSKNDAFNYVGDIFKTGRIRISLDPNPFVTGSAFRQTLDIAYSCIVIEAGKVSIRIWADANRPVFHVEIQSPQEIAVTAQPELWKRIDHCDFDCVKNHTPGVIGSRPPTQDVMVEGNGNVLWYYHVGDQSVVPDDLQFYDVQHMAGDSSDPYRFNTFGNLLESSELQRSGGVLGGRGTRFDIRIHALTLQTPDPADWIDAIERQAMATNSTPLEQAWMAHVKWWSAFWNRSWIIASDRTVATEQRERFQGEPSADGMRHEADGAALVAQSYNVFRYLMACQSRGRIPTKFNGGLFTQQLHIPTNEGVFGRTRSDATQQRDGSWLMHEDDRLWGRRFTFQNQRLMYWPMLAGGDFDLMKPFFDYYWQLLPMREAITKAWFGHDGAYYRENIEPHGAERDCDNGDKPPKTKPGESYTGWYHDYYFTCGLEIVTMMLDFVAYTGNTNFRDQVLVPFARQILLFFDLHYPRDSAGKLRFDPAQVLETWWIAVNPTPDIAGLRFCLEGLMEMGAGTQQDQQRWRALLQQVPEIPLCDTKSGKAIAPAERFEKKSNDENGELYAAFPFRCFGVANGTGDTVERTMRHVSCIPSNGHGACWSQDDVHWACAGNAREAAEGLVRRFRVASNMCRFPLYGREKPDSCPDFDHFGSGAIALQRMLLQEANGKILLLPAWPANWDVDFKLHASGGAVITGTFADGELTNWAIEPASRRADVTICRPG